MPLPPTLPWEQIKLEIETAAMRAAKSRFMSIRDLAEHILKNPGDYPAIMKPRDDMSGPTTERTLYNRIHTAVSGNNEVAGLLWPRWNAGRANGRKGAIFILPWKSEDPLIVAARADRDTLLFPVEVSPEELSEGRAVTE